VLVHTYGLTQQRNGMLRLCGVTEPVAALLKMTKTDSFFPVDADATASLALMGSSVA
jgi:anti-anti-sigma regulatory factor